MWWLFVVFLGGCLAEWPPSSCDPQVDIRGNMVTLTGVSNKENQCTIREQFFDNIFINLERKYSDNNLKITGDSILGLTMIHPGGQHTILVHDNRIEMAERKCRGMFMSNTLLKIQIRRAANKTTVYVMKMTNNQFSQCLNFDINELINGITLKIHATTDTGMIQIIHGISSHDVSSKKYRQISKKPIKEEIRWLKTQLTDTQDTLRTTIERLEQNHLLVRDNHNEMKKVLDSSLRHTDSRIALKVRHHSYGLISVIVISSILMCVFIKYNGYTRKRIEHIL